MLKIIKNADGKFGYQELDEKGKVLSTGPETFATEVEAKKFVVNLENEKQEDVAEEEVKTDSQQLFPTDDTLYIICDEKVTAEFII